MVITDTSIAQTKGIVNGTPCTAHSLTPEGLSASEFEAMLRDAGPGGIVTLDRPPRSINVEPQVCQKFMDRLRPDSLDRDRVVIPITWANATIGDTPWVRTSLFAVQNGIAEPRRRKKKDGTMTKKATSGIVLKQHSVELAFAVTDVRRRCTTALAHMSNLHRPSLPHCRPTDRPTDRRCSLVASCDGRSSSCKAPR